MTKRLLVFTRAVAVALTVALVVGVFGAGAGALPNPSSRPTIWIRPVAGPVVRAFDAPRTTYGPGHRGVDFAAPAGTPVEAAGPGVVVFAGRIGPSSHVVVLHPGSGWRTGYSFLAGVTVRRGETVAGGTVVGTTGGVGDGHDGTVLHFSLRIGDEYVDPMILFQPLDLAVVVHLAPTNNDGSGMGFVGRRLPFASERAALLEGLEGLVSLATNADAPERRPPRRFVRWRWF